MNKMRAIVPTLALVAGVMLSCQSAMQTTEFLNPRFDFSFVERMAVLPFENLSEDRQAGARATRLTITELLASGSVDVVEPGEVAAALTKLRGSIAGRVRQPSTEEIVALAAELDVQAVILGSVTQSATLRSAGLSIPVVTLDVHMVEAETGATVWAATHSEKGTSFSGRVLGTGAKPIAETTRLCLQKMLGALIE
jgi:TolB-like protein